MATWKTENVLLTLKGNEALSKVLAGQGKLTVTRIVTGAGYVPPSTLYNQKNVSDIKQTLEISRVVTDANGSEISTTLSNINLDTAYSLYQIGVYCRHTDSDEEFLYLIAQCETDKPDTIPANTDTIANFSYNLYIQHEGTTQFEVTVNQSGVLDVGMLGKSNGVAGLDSEGLIPKEVIPNASKIYLSDGVTSVEEAVDGLEEGITAAIDAHNKDTGAHADIRESISAHISNKSNPHSVTKAQVGLGNVNNTSDSAKPVSTAQATAIADAKKAGTDAQSSIDTHAANKRNPHGVTAAQVGAIATSQKGAKNGVATLDSSGKVPSGQLPEIGYTKEETLSDAAKTAFGLGADAVPDDVLQILSRLHTRLGDDYLWQKQSVLGEIKEATESSSLGRMPEDATIYYYDSVQIDLASQTIIGVGEHKISNQPYGSNQWNKVVGKYMLYPYDKGSWPPNTFYRVTARPDPNDAIFTAYAQYAEFTLGPAQYLNSPNANAYHSGVVDGVLYDALGKIGNKLQIQTGTYVGSGVYGSTNQNILTFEFVPKIVIVLSKTGTALNNKDSFIYIGQPGSTENQMFYLNLKTLSWHNDRSAQKQCNTDGSTYYYVAIG